tara:strand:+ start:292 stop:738 length:447 start_codon:yes stop_codon:yes gene_type:complete
LAAFVAKDGWSIITATQEAIGEPDHPKNITANEDLRRHLQETGVPFIDVTGMYAGNPQGASFIIIADEATAMAYSKRYMQESILTKDGLVYSKPYPNVPTTGVILSGPETLKEDFTNLCQRTRPEASTVINFPSKAASTARPLAAVRP